MAAFCITVFGLGHRVRLSFFGALTQQLLDALNAFNRLLHDGIQFVFNWYQFFKGTFFAIFWRNVKWLWQILFMLLGDYWNGLGEELGLHRSRWHWAQLCLDRVKHLLQFNPLIFWKLSFGYNFVIELANSNSHCHRLILYNFILVLNLDRSDNWHHVDNLKWIWKFLNNCFLNFLINWSFVMLVIAAIWLI